jgi:hypothetical protein
VTDIGLCRLKDCLERQIAWRVSKDRYAEASPGGDEGVAAVASQAAVDLDVVVADGLLLDNGTLGILGRYHVGLVGERA